MSGEATSLGEVFLEPAVAAAQLGVSVRRLRRMRQAGTGPAFYTIGAKILYSAEDLRTWFREATPLP